MGHLGHPAGFGLPQQKNRAGEMNTSMPTSAFSPQPFALRDAPALIERLLPVQKLSAEAFKEQMAGSGKTLTALGSYWKGRKPLILNKACILGCLLPATDNPKRDLEIFEKLMAMDDESFIARWPRRPKPREILTTLSIARIADYFVSDPPMLLPQSAPVDWSKPELAGVKVRWRDEFLEKDEWEKLGNTSALSLQPCSCVANLKPRCCRGRLTASAWTKRNGPRKS
jgi:putative DNA methylase